MLSAMEFSLFFCTCTKVSTAAIFECLLHYAICPAFHIEDVDKIHTNAGSAFKSAEFISHCEQHVIKVTFAAPRHQETNGICEQKCHHGKSEKGMAKWGENSGSRSLDSTYVAKNFLYFFLKFIEDYDFY